MVRKRQGCNQDQKTRGLEGKIIKMLNPVALWSENGSQCNRYQKKSGLDVKQTKCETRLQYGKKPALIQPGSQNKWFTS